MNPVFKITILFLLGHMVIHAHPVFFVIQSEKEEIYFKADVSNMAFCRFNPLMNGLPCSQKRDYKATSKMLSLLAKDRTKLKGETYKKKASLIIQQNPSDTFKRIQITDKEWARVLAYARKLMLTVPSEKFKRADSNAKTNKTPIRTSE